MARYTVAIPPFMAAFFEEKVNSPYREHPDTAAWTKEILETPYVPYHTGRILKGGMVDFQEGYQGLTPDDLVLVYCNYMMQMHAVTSYQLLRIAQPIFGNLARSDDLITVDFGCGPLTWGVALAWYYLSLGGQDHPAERLRLRYIGLDQSPAVLNRAIAMAKCPLLFAPDCQAAFGTPRVSDANIWRMIEKYIGDKPQPLIVLNFTYLFASPTLSVPPLVKTVNAILERYEQHTICLTFQNRPVPHLNLKWRAFKISLPVLHTIFSNTGRHHDTVRYNDTTGRRGFPDTTPYLYYEVLSNRAPAVLFGAAGP